MNRRPRIVRILANDAGVYEVGVRAPGHEYERADQLSALLRPAIEAINGAIRVVYRDSETRGDH